MSFSEDLAAAIGELLNKMAVDAEIRILRFRSPDGVDVTQSMYNRNIELDTGRDRVKGNLDAMLSVRVEGQHELAFVMTEEDGQCLVLESGVIIRALD
jgi:hypothetical protein